MRKAIICLMVFACLNAAARALQVETRNKGEATTIDFVLYDANSPHRLLTDAVSASGDCLISKNEGEQTVVEANFVDEGYFYSLALTAGEMNADRIMIIIADQSAPGLWMDAPIIINTTIPGAADANILAALAQMDSNLAAKIDDVNTIIDLMADPNGDVSLSAVGLDNIPTTEPNGVADTFREMNVQTWRRFFKKAAMTDTALYTYNDANAACTEQTVSNDGTTQIVDNAEAP